MLYANELIMLILGTGVLFLTILNKPKIRRIYAWKLLLLAFYYYDGRLDFHHTGGIFHGAVHKYTGTYILFSQCCDHGSVVPAICRQ